jgi:hypothetical protein
MASDFPQIISPAELHRLGDISQLDDTMFGRTMFDNPHAVIDYILSVREDPQQLDDIQKKIAQVSERRQAAKKRRQEREAKEDIEDGLDSSTGQVFVVATGSIVTSGMAVVFFSSMFHGIPPWSSEFELIRKNCLTAKWHCILPFSFIVIPFCVGCVQGYQRTKVSLADTEKDNSRLGIKRRLAQIPFRSFLGPPAGVQDEKKPYFAAPRDFADYVGSMKISSRFSKWQTVGLTYMLFLNLWILCCLPFFDYAEDEVKSRSCVGPWAKAGLLLVVLVFCHFVWMSGSCTGWAFGMGSLAEALRKECLRKNGEPEGCEESGKQRLESLVTEILQDKIAGDDEKSAEELQHEKQVLEILVKRIRC